MPQPVGIDLQPLAADPDQRLLGLDQIGDLPVGERLRADRELPLEGRDALLADAGGAGDHAGLARRRDPQLGAELRRSLRPPARKQYAESGREQQRCGLGEQRVRARRVEVERRRPGGAQRHCQRRVEPHGATELGEQRLLRIGDVPGERTQRGPGPPDPRGVDDEAGFVGGL